MQKICKKCNSSFEITSEDLEFYKKVSPKFEPSPNLSQGERDNWNNNFLIPSPTLCPDCRQQRRLAFRNERKLYKRKCDATGENIISMYSSDKKIKVYNADFWWSDKWDALNYGIEFDFEKWFFEQFWKLIYKVPKPALINIKQEWTDYSNFSWWNKNSYLIFTSWKNENSYYSNRIWKSINVMDCLGINNCENSYQIIDSNNCKKSSYLINSENCFDCHFSDNLIWCNNCFYSTNLVNKNYYYDNKKYTKDEYLKKIKEYKDKEINFWLIKKNINWTNNEYSTWDWLFNTKNAKDCFIWTNIIDSKFITNATNITDSYDLTNDDNSKISYESIWWETNNNHIFNNICWINNNISYCSDCHHSSNLFWCIWLKDKQYCILNKQYTKEEYNELVPKIIDKMINDWEWWEFFPASLSPFWYNETVAQEYFPLEKKDVSEKHLYKFNWSDYESPKPNVEKIIPAEKLPENIVDIPDDILNWAIECEVSKKPFRIIKQELEFYRKHNLPVPHKHPDIRHLERMKLRNPRKLFDRKCDKCWVEMKSTYKEDREEIVICEKCYEKEIY